jgi:hypothetical protein
VVAPVIVHRVTPILNVSHVGASMAWFEQIGWKRTFEWADEEGAEPDFGGVENGAAEIFLCLDGQGSRGAGGAWMSWWLDSVAEVDALHARAVALGLDVPMAPADEPWGVHEFHLRHPDGHTFRVSAHRGS